MVSMDRNLTVNEQHELRVLELVEEREKITQRGVAAELEIALGMANALICLLYTSPSPRDISGSRMPSSA